MSTSNLAKRIKSSFDAVYDLKDDGADGTQEPIAPIFNTMPDKKLYPDYYDVITTPTSLQSIKKRLNIYHTPNDFIKDLAQIVWNAKTYNEQGSFVYRYAQKLDSFILSNVIPKFRKLGYEVSYPNLGPNDLSELASGAQTSTANTPQPNAVLQNNNAEEDDHSDDDQANSRLRKASSTTAIQSTKEQSYKRGRPPVIDKPFEQRIKNVLRSLRRDRDQQGQLLCHAFEKLPDIRENPQFYQLITDPISLDEIKKKIKQRKYKDVETYVQDMKLMFNNGRTYYKGWDENMVTVTNTLETKFGEHLEIELKRPDSDFVAADSLKIPLDQLELHGSLFKIGDWILINNPNDPSKPIVSQLFRIWQTQDGQRWINVCWYLRPEQTVHRVDRLFYENEVFKSGQYRDHLADEIIGKCYVAYFTRYQRGDPAFNYEGPLFICEFRYNDNDKNFNKIRTWKACLPDEVRDHEDPITPLPNLRRFKKYESPLKHLLPPNATMDMPIPEPTIGAPNAPPLHGAVYLRDIDEADDLGQYASSRICPRYIIRPNDPPPTDSPSNNTTSIVNYTRNTVPVPQQQPILHHAVPNYVPTSTAPSFTIPISIENDTKGLIRMDVSNNRRRLAGISNDVNTEGPLIWFRAPGVNIGNRYKQQIPVRGINRIVNKKPIKRPHNEIDGEEEEQDLDNGDEDSQFSHSLGHSAKYLAFKLQKQQNKQSV
ncbi:Chromatin structure-remodeling complex subunit [Wickerhamomyces ciferrii]|uniref:Chromatin structure-remodeling complex subunit n=1 Tax=Wickerhamomyces ciferrii (strain ATCC 14091 / BCRC 22168 / CBS 111 / JCM 3599 / NBRC 0793 / NRRL Y-1031 F-60-10) TaxID=1206466 RepID=K0KL11_WICCF|nr:Chromatin structure-remodeling complex subunit [Wickerhamomyces ciferrii]CCH41773.1 Chromatin structure-remodeling complex subunit [Wickerhamomyces ciferrii]